jgi:hypothetical protein
MPKISDGAGADVACDKGELESGDGPRSVPLTGRVSCRHRRRAVNVPKLPEERMLRTCRGRVLGPHGY